MSGKYLFLVTEDDLDDTDPVCEAVYCTEDKSDAYYEAKKHFCSSSPKTYEVFVSSYWLPEWCADITAEEAVSMFDGACLVVTDEDGDETNIEPGSVDDERTIAWAIENPMNIYIDGECVGIFPEPRKEC